MQLDQPCHRQRLSYWVDILFLTLVVGSLFFILLGTRPLFVPDEGRYAEIAREMVERQDYLTPYLNYIKYFEKPVLYYWLSAAAIKLGGLNIWAIRSVNAFLALIGCLLTYLAGRKLYNRQTGLFAALILATSTLYFVMAHMVSLDLPLTVFLLVSLYAFIIGIHQPVSWQRRLYFWCVAAGAALAMLTKGLIGVVFPTLTIGCWLSVMGEWRTLKQMYLPSSLLIFLLLVLPWHILVGRRNPEFFYFYFINQHVLRYLTPNVGHYQPIWFFIPTIIAGLFPWIIFLPSIFTVFLWRAWKERRTYQTELFLLSWSIIIFVFFSFSKSKLIPYILPVFPPLTMLIARYLDLAANAKRWVGIKISYVCLVLLALIVTYAFWSFLKTASLPDPTAASFYLYLASLTLIVGSIITCSYALQNKIWKAIIATITMAWLFLLSILTSLPYIDTRTVLPLAIILKPMLKPENVVATYNQYYQDLPFYLEHRITILNWRNELTFGMQHQNTHEWMIDDTTFWQYWHAKQRMFAVISQAEYSQLEQKYPQEKIFILANTRNNLLISNQGGGP